MFDSGHVNLDEIAEVLDYSHRYGRYVSGLCPFHDDHKPSFFVYPDSYICLSCGAHGKSSTLLEKLKPGRNLFTPTKTEQYFRNPWTNWVKDVSFDAIFSISLKHSPSQYLKDRGIDEVTQKKLKIGMLDNWILFPIIDDGGWILGGVARAGETNHSTHKYILPAGQDPNLLYVPSWKRIMNKDYVMVTFGILDAVTLYMLGFSALSLTTGKRCNPIAFESIRKHIIIIPDLGEDMEANVLASKLGWRGQVLRLQYPENAKDINDLSWKSGWSNDKIREVINELV